MLSLEDGISWQGKFQRSHWFFLGRDFAKRNVSMETVISRVYPINYRCGKYNIENFFLFFYVQLYKMLRHRA